MSRVDNIVSQTSTPASKPPSSVSQKQKTRNNPPPRRSTLDEHPTASIETDDTPPPPKKSKRKVRKEEPERVRFYSNVIGKIKPRAYVRRLNGIRVVLYDFSGLKNEERQQLTVYYRSMLSKLLKSTDTIRGDVFNFKELKTLEQIYGAFAWVKRHTAIVRSLYRYKLILMGVFVAIEFLLKLFIPMDGFVISQMGMLKEYDDLIYDWSEQQGTGYTGGKRCKRVRTNPIIDLVKSMTISTGIYVGIGIIIKYYGFSIPQETVFKTIHGFIDQMKSGELEGSDLISKLAGLYTAFTGGSSSRVVNTPISHDPLAINPL